MRVLITGGAGFVGSHTVLTLLKKGIEVTIIDSFQNCSKKSIDAIKQIAQSVNPNSQNNIDFLLGDILDLNFLEKVFEDENNKNKKFDGVIHLAGLKSVSDSIKNPFKYWETNVGGTMNLIKIMDKFKCYRLVFSSSATIYGVSGIGKIKEDSEINPINPYGTTKLAIETFLNDLYKSHTNKWGIINLRYFNPIGAHESGSIGENPTGDINNIFPLINKVAQKKIKELHIYGSDWDTPDGTCIRDYIHIMDLAEAHFLAINYLFKNENDFLNLNLGTGKGHSILQLIKTFEKVNKVKIPYIFSRRRDGDISSVVADNKKALEVLNWKPERNIEDMCIDGWKWYSKNPDGF